MNSAIRSSAVALGEVSSYVLFTRRMMFAAIALTYGLTFVTHNPREFEPVVDLSLVDWEA